MSIAERGRGRDAGDPRLWVGVCGPFSLKVGDKEYPAIPAGQRVVLTLLVLASNAAIRTDSFIATLWPDRDPPATASGMVHTYVCRLRAMFKAAGDGEDPISRDGSGYRISLATDQLDALTFRRLVDLARKEPDANDSCDLYERAMQLWRGGAVEDIDILRMHPAVTALTSERVIVALEYAHRAAAAGRHAAVLPHLERLAASNPLDERVYAALMIALAGDGRQAESLRVYDGLRRRLSEELGMSPGEELRQAHQTVLRQQVTHGRPSDIWREVHQLPAVPVDFTGRTTQRDALTHSIIVSRDRPGVAVAVVSGQPGVGKTTLALYVAHSVSHLFPDGQLWVQLAGASERSRDPHEILGEMLRALGVPGPAIPDDLSSRSAALRTALAGRKVLIVADDAASAEQVAPLLPGTSGCAIIVTSRVQLHELAGTTHVPLSSLATSEAAQFLGRLASHDRVAADPEAVAQLVHACGGVPLALRIVGSRLAARPQWPLSVMVRKLARAENQLSELEAGTMSVRASIDSSYIALSERERLAFRRLALLGPNDFAGWVVGVLLDEPDADDVLDNLVSRSLITPGAVDATGEPRYRLHDLLREYAADHLAADEAASTSSAVERLLHAWLQLVQHADAGVSPAPYFPRSVSGFRPAVLPERLAEILTSDPIAWFTVELFSLRHAIERACETGNLDIACELANRQYSFHYLQERFDAGERIWNEIMEAARNSAEPDVQARAALGRGAAMARRGLSSDAAIVLDSCIERFESVGERTSMAFALYWRALCAWDLDDFGTARRFALRGLEASRSAGNLPSEIANARIVGLSFALGGRHASALEVCEQAMGMAEKLGSDLYTLVSLHSLALTACLAGQYERAVTIAERVVDLSRELNSVQDEATAYGVMADAYLGMHRYADAVTMLLKALPAFQIHKAERHQALALLKLGSAYQGMGREAEAMPCLDKSVELFTALRLPRKVELARDARDRCVLAIGKRNLVRS